MTEIREKWQGLHAGRYEREPLEKKFALAWQELCESVGGPNGPITHLDYLLCDGDQAFVRPCSDRDRLVANTVIQWLGSAVGSAFVREVLHDELLKTLSECGADFRHTIKCQHFALDSETHPVPDDERCICGLKEFVQAARKAGAW